MFFMNRTFKKNSTRLLKICGELIEKYQSNPCAPSSKQDLLQLITSRIHSAKDEVSNWNDYRTDYVKIAHTLLVHATFDLLASGKYHVYAGVLNPMSCAENMMDVYKASMDYAVKRGFIDEDAREEQYKYLISCIANVG